MSHMMIYNGGVNYALVSVRRKAPRSGTRAGRRSRARPNCDCIICPCCFSFTMRIHLCHPEAEPTFGVVPWQPCPTKHPYRTHETGKRESIAKKARAISWALR
ncbi:hypothetical protein FOCG_00504 [Fusarium oxysporum f. sp. radicis-lycopersici 26381]|uniref:Uncharacterized protein n=1 Tax=Fusarium oxysporum Fo47 TaxID=660027 RepID=W9KPU1_FUSOX|nr:hypothetical protein FOZG_05000 [Fusarium oxysporum Fo47]EWZ99089.1 hypothetical protein FOWG_02884 [Fusarium oxysporum f. sp. lycopersici MN25]EXL61370.1 hypothetical protein FOCG_00504 [Fusarium oxysporum f. sp. radicis-lycopersici 26381]